MRRPSILVRGVSSKRPRQALACAVLAISLVLSSSLAGFAEAEDDSHEATEPAVHSIPIAEIGVSAQQTRRLVSDIEKAPASDAVEVRQLLPSTRTRVSEGLSRSGAIRADNPSVLAVRQLTDHWADLVKELEQYQQRVTQRAEEIADQLAAIRAQAVLWDATRVAAKEVHADPLVIGEIDGVEQIIETAQANARERQAEVLAVQSEIATLQESVAADIEQIAALQLAMMGNLFDPDQPPIWSRAFWASIGADEVEDRREYEIQRHLSAIKSLWYERRDATVLLLAAACASAASILYLRARAPRAPADEEGDSELAIFSRPVSVAILVAVIMARFGFAHSWSTLFPIFAALALLPAVLILRKLLAPAMYPLLNAVMALFVITRLGTLLVPWPGLSRLVHLVEILGAIAILVHWGRRSRIERLRSSTQAGVS